MMLYCMDYVLNFSFLTKKYMKTIKFIKNLTVLCFLNLNHVLSHQLHSIVKFLVKNILFVGYKSI